MSKLEALIFQYGVTIYGPRAFYPNDNHFSVGAGPNEIAREPTAEMAEGHARALDWWVSA